jgi:hypothetical protein
MKEQLRAYEATGRLHYADGSSIECEATITQDHDGALSLSYAALRPGQSPPLQWFDESFGHGQAQGFEGHTADAAAVRLTGMFQPADGHWNPAEGTRRAFRIISIKGDSPSKLEVGTPSADKECEWRFGIANLLFDPPARGSRTEGDSDGDVLVLHLGQQVVRLQRVTDYKDAEADLEAHDAVRITAHACLSGALSLDDAKVLVTDLCALLSIAHGTLINWAYCDQVIETGQRLYSLHHDSVARPHSGALPLISPTAPRDLSNFLERAFEPFIRKREDWRLLGLSRAYADIRTTGFLEARCLQAGCLIDFITGKDAELAGDTTVMPEEVFKAQLPRVRGVLLKVLLLAFPTLSKARANAMTQNVSYWNHRTFGQKIELTAKRFGFAFPSEELKPVIATRNELVHRMKFQNEGDEWTECARTLSVLDRLLMGLLEYRGPYIDPVRMERVEPTAPGTQ